MELKKQAVDSRQDTSRTRSEEWSWIQPEKSKNLFALYLRTIAKLFQPLPLQLTFCVAIAYFWHLPKQLLHVAPCYAVHLKEVKKQQVCTCLCP